MLQRVCVCVCVWCDVSLQQLSSQNTKIRVPLCKPRVSQSGPRDCCYVCCESAPLLRNKMGGIHKATRAYTHTHWQADRRTGREPELSPEFWLTTYEEVGGDWKSLCVSGLLEGASLSDRSPIASLSSGPERHCSVPFKDPMSTYFQNFLT